MPKDVGIADPTTDRDDVTAERIRRNFGGRHPSGYGHKDGATYRGLHHGESCARGRGPGGEGMAPSRTGWRPFFPVTSLPA
jgi:hypothetical protein